MESNDRFDRLERMLSIALEQISKLQTEQTWLDKSQLGTYLNVHEDTAVKMAYKAGLKPKKKQFINQRSLLWKRSEVDTKLIVEPEQWHDGDLKNYKIPQVK